jgi:hypothetical protein
VPPKNLNKIHNNNKNLTIATQSFVLAKQALYHLRYNHSPFCSGYFGHRVLLFAQVSLDPDPPILGFLLLPG